MREIPGYPTDWTDVCCRRKTLVALQSSGGKKGGGSGEGGAVVPPSHPLGHHRAPALCNRFPLALCFMHGNVHVWRVFHSHLLLLH